MQTDIHTETYMQPYTHRHKKRRTYTERHTGPYTETHIQRHTDAYRHTLTHTQTEKHIDTHTYTTHSPTYQRVCGFYSKDSLLYGCFLCVCVPYVVFGHANHVSWCLSTSRLIGFISVSSKWLLFIWIDLRVLVFQFFLFLMVILLAGRSVCRCSSCGLFSIWWCFK